MHRLLFVSVLAISVATAGALLAKTPDGQPPSQEDVCAGLSRSAYGICNAYCEAQDCDVHPRPSCERLRERFARATGGETRFPCDVVACGDATAPECDGECPEGEVCTSGVEIAVGIASSIPPGRVCACVPERPTCGEASAPACDGECPPGSVCTSGPEDGPGIAPVGCVCTVP